MAGNPVTPPKQSHIGTRALQAVVGGCYRAIRSIAGERVAMDAAEFLYVTVLKPRVMKAIVNRLILGVLPRRVAVGGAMVVVNPKDPVVSGALTFGVYEKSEILFMTLESEPGQVMIDVGANVGLYTAIAGVAVGPTGRVFAFEPDPECFGYLRKTVEANSLENVETVRAAASSAAGTMKLFTSSDNRGDNRLYREETSDGSVDVATVRLDDFLAAKGIVSVDIVKIDVQGFEAHVVDGLELTIRRSPKLKMLMEFWPYGLTCAGSDPIKLMDRLEGFGLQLCELLEGAKLAPVLDKNELVGRLRGRKYTNLVLLGPDAKLRARH